MTDKKFQTKRISLTNTKQEMLAAYNELVTQLHERREVELKPEDKIQEKAQKKLVEIADALSTEGAGQAIATLKLEVGRFLSQLSERLEEEVIRYKQVTAAVEAKEKELQEIYEIQKSASSLAALIEAQYQKRQEFEFEMASRKDELGREMQTLRTEWDKEKKQHEAEIKHRDAAESKQHEREKEEYLYAFEREQLLSKDRFQDEKLKLEREIQYKREQMERELAERERTIGQREAELNELREKVSGFPKTLESGIGKAVKEAVERVQGEVKTREDLLKKEFEGERNVLNTRIAALEKTVTEQNERVATLTQQAEKAYNQVQDIAVRAIEGSSNLKALTSLQQLVTEQARKSAPEK